MAEILELQQRFQGIAARLTALEACAALVNQFQDIATRISALEAQVRTIAACSRSMPVHIARTEEGLMRMKPLLSPLRPLMLL
jgi:hypothetical protein